jgi:hypothetical protein
MLKDDVPASNTGGKKHHVHHVLVDVTKAKHCSKHNSRFCRCPATQQLQNALKRAVIWQTSSTQQLPQHNPTHLKNSQLNTMRSACCKVIARGRFCQAC